MLHLQKSDHPTLTQAIGQTFILAYRESTEQLDSTLSADGLICEVLRQHDQPDYQGYASIYRCMLNHQQAWMRAAAASLPTLVVEADFVPVVGFGQLPLPFALNQPDVGICWLYSCAPQLYSVSPDGFGEGFSTGLVAYIVTPQAGAALCEMVAEVTRLYGTGYSNFDSTIDRYLRAKSLKNYIPFRNYGEHGGIPNPEHRRNGLSGIHRADVLYGPLAFTPAYAEAAPASKISARIQARTKGLARLLLGKFLRLKVLKNSSSPLRLLRFAVGRQVSNVL
jgi:hypothetical protein